MFSRWWQSDSLSVVEGGEIREFVMTAGAGELSGVEWSEARLLSATLWVIDWEWSAVVPPPTGHHRPQQVRRDNHHHLHHWSPRPRHQPAHQDQAGREGRAEVAADGLRSGLRHAGVPPALCGLIGKFAWTTVRSRRAKLEQTSLDLDLYTTRAASCSRTPPPPLDNIS